ncbi:MAG TPA: hypothetical protein VG502_13600 [Flexivirga sp.]|uniref:hypothetical protein n=1 Tax=Flexivirga sp. TaxID=1962927 RepID=UPI002B55676B|nr:hypothetical protein [Flexivirga sp.]HWC23328.1 hypothetical protein [Flexivirga sp.]
MRLQHSGVQLDPPSGALLLGGDQLHWSDLERVEPSSATSYLLSRLITERRPRTVLLLGPRAAGQLDAVASPEVSVLVRGLPDARQLSGLARERDELRVFCGAFDRFPTDRSYDLVVCLDGPTTLATPDSPGASQAELLRLVTSVLAPDGTAVLSIDNTLGLDELLRLELRTTFDDDSQWFRGAPDFAQRSPYRHEVPALLADAGLQVQQGFSAYTSAQAPVLLVSDGVADESARSGTVRRTLTALLQHLEANRHSRTPALADPYAVARKVVAAGLLSQVAPAWLLVTGHAASGATTAQLPDIVLGDDVAASEWAAVLTLDRTAEGWSRNAAGAHGDLPLAERRLRRDLRRLGVSDFSRDGESLQERLRVAAGRGDVHSLRDAIRGYAEWMLDPDFADPSTRFFATPDNVVVDAGGSHGLLDGSWSWAEALEPELAVVRGLRVFARHLLRSGAEHRWRPDISPDELTRTLAAMAELPVDPAVIDRIAQREAEISAVLQQLSAVDESHSYATNLAGGASQFTATPGPARGYRESLALTGRMSQELHERGEQVQWLESSLRDRDRRVAALERELSSVRGSVSYRAGRKITAPGRGAGQAVVRAGRKGALSMLPPDFAPRAERALRKLLDR